MLKHNFRIFYCFYQFIGSKIVPSGELASESSICWAFLVWYNKNMSKVYFLKNFKKLSKASDRLLSDIYSKESKLLVKIHFGEPGNKFAFFPKDVKQIIEALKSQRIKITFVDTPVAYTSPRDSVSGYEKVAKERGWNNLGSILISNRFKRVKTKDFTAEVCRELIRAPNVLVISHVKGHACAGLGGAIKNLGMGGLSAKTKSKIHNLCKPHFIAECQGCGTCAKLCPAGAIKMKGGKAKLNNNKCFGCSICQLECAYNCLAPKKATFDDLLGQGAAAVINNLPQKTFFINILKDITKGCDCVVDPGGIVAKDVGVLFSDNPVAIDKASLDLIRKVSGKKLFKMVNNKDPLLQVNFASKYTKWKSDYELISV